MFPNFFILSSNFYDFAFEFRIFPFAISFGNENIIKWAVDGSQATVSCVFENGAKNGCKRRKYHVALFSCGCPKKISQFFTKRLQKFSEWVIMNYKSKRGTHQ